MKYNPVKYKTLFLLFVWRKQKIVFDLGFIQLHTILAFHWVSSFFMDTWKILYDTLDELQ